jgi:hypothetical protein
MNQSKAEAIVARLLTNAAGLRYGSVSVSAKLHDGRVVEVSYIKTEQTREREACRRYFALDGVCNANSYAQKPHGSGKGTKPKEEP